MIIIEGLEAGGQILRTALGLSLLTNKPFKIINIRKSRPKPGLKAQHLACIDVLRQISNARVENAYLGSQEITFQPGKVNSSKIKVRVNTAGSTALILQSLLIAGINNDIKLTIKGGATFGKWAPPITYLENILIPLLNKMDYNPVINTLKHGFYPKGGALIQAVTKPSIIKPINITEKGKILVINGISMAESSLKSRKVAERQANHALTLLKDKFKTQAKIKIEYVKAKNPGSCLQLWIITENSIIGSDALGEINKSSEQVAEEAVEVLMTNYKGAVDKYAADQLIPYMALAGDSKIKSSEITNHILANCKVVEKFLDVKFTIKDSLIECSKD